MTNTYPTNPGQPTQPVPEPIEYPQGAVPAAPPVPPGYGDIARFPDGKPMFNAAGEPVSTKSRLAALLLAWFLGVFGVHRFYVGKVGTGILMILTLGGLGIWALIDFIMIAVGSFRDKAGKPLTNW